MKRKLNAAFTSVWIVIEPSDGVVPTGVRNNKLTEGALNVVGTSFGGLKCGGTQKCALAMSLAASCRATERPCHSSG